MLYKIACLTMKMAIKNMAKFAVFIVLFVDFLQSFSIEFSCFSNLNLPSTVSYPESFTWDKIGGGPYTGVSDGRVLKYQGSSNGFVEFSYNSPRRYPKLCDGTTDIDLGPVCGSPLGVAFNNRTGSLFTADPFIGITEVGPFGGRAKILVPTQDGVPYKFLIGIAIDPQKGDVYVTDASSIYGPQDYLQSIRSYDSTGRLLKYDPITAAVTELRRNLSEPVGVECSADGKYLLFSEFIAKRIRKYWLTGEKAGNDETIKTFSAGNPNKIRRNKAGDYWVALNILMNNYTEAAPRAVKINSEGKLLAVVDLSKE